MNPVKLFILLLVFGLNSGFSSPAKNGMMENSLHDIHVSKCNIDFSDKEKTLQITIHIYLDDLEAGIKNQGVTERLNLCTEKENPKGNEFVLDYFQKMFSIQVNEKPVTYTMLGKEPTEDLLGGWFYLEVQNVQELKDLQFNYSLLTEIHSDQQSVVKVKGPNKKKGYFLLDKNKQSARVTF